jgi:nucleotide-binding universal stress UspA family protein
VLIPTDFSELSNHALASGYGLLRSGGEAHLVHVRHPNDEAVPAGELEARLEALIPEGAGERYITTRAHVVTDLEPYAGIMRLAERLAVDAICMSTHGRSGVSELALGSQAREVLRVASQPVLLVKGARE